MKEADDHELVCRFQAGDESAFNELAVRYRRGVFVTIIGIVGTSDDAEDLTQETFVKAYQSLKTFRSESSLYTWLYRIAVNLSLNHLRRRKVRSFFGLEKEAAELPSNVTADEGLVKQELSSHLRKAISELPDKQRTVFILRHFGELQHQEIAQILDRDVGTIKANYFHAIRALRTKLGSYIRGKDS